MGRLFGTDGVRGIANTELSCELAYSLGRAGAYILTKKTKTAPRILVAMDTRISGDMLESALCAGICSVGAHALLAGVMPTPAVAFSVRKHKLDAGIMISASHNPAEYNGIKFFDGDGFKLPDELENEIEEIILDGGLSALPSPTGGYVGKKELFFEASADYAEFLKASSRPLNGIKAVLDCSNGAAYKIAPEVFSGLGASVYIINNKPDGININDGCGSTHIDGLKKHVLETGADIGLAFDGDADRCLAVDENGNDIDGDKILSICGIHMKKNGLLKKDTIVGTVMSNMGFFIMGRNNGINIESANVGDRYVLELMLKNGYNLGGEQSGHIIFLDHNTTGDGILTGIKLLNVLKECGGKASKLAGCMDILPQVLVNAVVTNETKNKYTEFEKINSAISALSKKYESNGRVLIRTSGTEPLVRVMIEGMDKEEITKDAHELALLIEKELLK